MSNTGNLSKLSPTMQSLTEMYWFPACDVLSFISSSLRVNSPFGFPFDAFTFVRSNMVFPFVSCFLVLDLLNQMCSTLSMNRYKQHQKLLENVIISIQKKYPKARLFSRHVGTFRFLRSEGVVKINKKGMADIWGLHNGNHFEIEIKSGEARQTKEQKQWENIVTECGSKYFVIRSVDEIQDLEL